MKVSKGLGGPLHGLGLAFSLAFAPSLAMASEDDSVQVADVVDVDHRLNAGRNHVELAYPGAPFLRVHLVGDLPRDASIVLEGANGETQHVAARDVVESGGDGFYAMTMDTDAIDVRVTAADGSVIRDDYALRIDKIDVGFEQEASPAPFAVIGEDQRRPVECYQVSEPAAYRRSLAVARTYSKGRLGTAWRVSGENRMMTNHHVMGNAANARDYELWFGYQAPCGGGAARRGVKVRGGERLIGDRGLDFQLFTVADADFQRIAEFGYLGLDVGPLEPGRVIYIPQHGAGRPRQLAIFVDDGTRCTITSTPKSRGQYKCDTKGGSSGSPVIDANTGRVVVLHNSAVGRQNQGHRIERIWPLIQGHFAKGAVPETSP
ncbi:MAG TPA: serine protease [Dyella sp.]|uniref:trypsin-like serine peptidase n=1 Tax=Dyella sp. TaxID=1869338 RepID=UPI002F956775